MNFATSTDAIRHYCGRAAITPDRAVAGAFGTWRIVHTVGAFGLDIGARLRLAYRLASDWGPLQSDDPSAAGYISVESRPTGGVFRVRFDPRGHTRPWSQALLIDVAEHELSPGHEVIITVGDTRGGSPGCAAQTFVEYPFRFMLLTDPFGTGEFVGLVDPLEIDVSPGAAHHLRALAPSTISPRAPFVLTVKAEDTHGNPAVGYSGTVRFAEWTRLPAYAFSAEDAGVHRFEVPGAREGIHRVEVIDREHGMRCESNPVVARGALDRRVYWGDIHGQTGETVGTGPVSAYFPFARRYGALDFAAHCGNDFELTDEVFESLRAAVVAHHAPGTFVTFLSYEWSGNTPAGGDHNVYFLNDSAQIHRSSSWRIPNRPFHDTADLFPLARLYEAYRGRDDILIIPHIGGRHADLGVFDPALSPFIEIASVHGWFEWFAREALQRGLRVGFVAGSDDHTGRPGASYPAGHAFGVRGGLIAAWAGTLTREGLWDAFRTRQVYGTSGERIYLDVSVNGHPMGATCAPSGAADLRVDVAGTAGLERIDVWRGTRLWHSEVLRPPDPASGRLAITWRGARNKGRQRLCQWNGHARLERGHIVSVKPGWNARPSGRDPAVERDEAGWRSSTVGNTGRVVLAIDAPEDARMRLDVGPLGVEFPLAQVGERTVWSLPEGIDCGVTAAWMPVLPYPKETQWARRDPDPPPGCTPYWVRITQEDGETAWSSPIFVVHRRAAR